MTNVTAANASKLERARWSWFGVLRSEWGKLWSLRSTYIIIAVGAVFMIGLSFLIAMGISEGLRDSGGFVFVPGLGDSVSPVIAFISLQGVLLAQFATGVLGVLLVTGEYSTGMIRSTLAATPTRLPVLVIKAIVVFVAAMLAMIPVAIIGFLVAQGRYTEFGIEAQLGDPGVPQIIIGVALYTAAVGVIGSGLGWLLRSAAGAIFALFILLMLLPLLLTFVDLDWVETLTEYLPGTAGQAVYTPTEGFDILPDDFEADNEGFGPWEGYAILWGWAIAMLAAGGWSLMRRDA